FRVGVGARTVPRQNATGNALDGFQFEQLWDVDKVTGDRLRRRHRRAHQVRAPTRALAPLEVAIRGRRAPLAWGQDVRVHAQTHRAPRVAPLKAGGFEHEVQAFLFRGALDRRRAGDDHSANFRMHAATLDHPRGGAQVFEARVGARADEDAVDGDVSQ